MAWTEESQTAIQLQNSENELKNLIFKSALNKIEDAASGIGHFNFQKLRLESGGPVDKPPTLEDYLKLGLSLAILTDDERRVVQEMLDKSLGTKKWEIKVFCELIFNGKRFVFVLRLVSEL